MRFTSCMTSYNTEFMGVRSIRNRENAGVVT
jgi:hypothetical protein